MTREEVLNMPAGREMDALVAERVMGFDVTPAFEGWYGELIPVGDREFIHPEGWTYANGTRAVPRYSQNISAAMEVQRAMARRGLCFRLSYDLIAWTAEFVDAATGKRACVNTTKSNAAEEICRAALLTTIE